MCPCIIEHLLIAVVRDIFALTLQTFELQVNYRFRNNGFCWDERSRLSFISSILNIFNSLTSFNSIMLNILNILAFCRYNGFGLWWRLSYFSKFRSINFFFAGDLFRNRCSLGNLVLFIAIIDIPLAHHSSKLILGSIITKFFHSLLVVFVTLCHQISENTLLRCIPWPGRFLVLGEHLGIPGPESMLTELKVVIYKWAPHNLALGRFESHEGWLFTIIISIVLDISFFGIQQITLFQLKVETIPSIFILIAIHDFLEFVGTNVCKLLDTKHLLRVGKIKF